MWTNVLGSKRRGEADFRLIGVHKNVLYEKKNKCSDSSCLVDR